MTATTAEEASSTVKQPGVETAGNIRKLRKEDGYETERRKIPTVRTLGNHLEILAKLKESLERSRTWIF